VVDPLRLVAEVSEHFIGLSIALRRRDDVNEAKFSIHIRTEEKVEDGFYVGRGNGYRIEWYVSIDFTSGDAIDFVQELSCNDSEWEISARVTGFVGTGENEDFLELPTRFAVDLDDLRYELLGQTAMLLSRQEEAMRIVGH
jgi:hypothetical protein